MIEKNLNPRMLLVIMQNFAAAIENNVKVPQKIKKNYHMIQQSLFCGYAQRK